MRLNNFDLSEFLIGEISDLWKPGIWGRSKLKCQSEGRGCGWHSQSGFKEGLEGGPTEAKEPHFVFAFEFIRGIH